VEAVVASASAAPDSIVSSSKKAMILRMVSLLWNVVLHAYYIIISMIFKGITLIWTSPAEVPR
jgi:hypothetical protein